jgi:predicted XRE-type DNA-binding protein
MARNDDMTVTRGSGNVFADLGLPDAHDHQIKAQVVLLIGQLVEIQGLTQTAAAARIGLSQPDLSKMLRGQFRGFSLERLLEYARALGADVDITMKAPKHADPHEGRMRLMVA